MGQTPGADPSLPGVFEYLFMRIVAPQTNNNQSPSAVSTPSLLFCEYPAGVEAASVR
jgi:hypothetical protein